jgi:hypothetical protein
MSKPRDVARILGRTEAANPNNVALSPVGSTEPTTQYDSIGLLPVTGLTAGTQAFVTSTNRLYVSNGSGWYNTALINATPALSLSSSGTIALTPGSATTITMTATDSDNSDANLVLSLESGGDLFKFATVSQDSSVVTITPRTEDSATALGSDGSATLTFKASDGINQATVQNTFTLSFGPDWSVAPTESIVRASDAAASDFYGVSTAISGDGNYAIAGADRNDDGLADAGSAYILTRSGSTWTQQAKITAGDVVANDYFGRAVSISSDGTYAVIGKPRISGVGQAYIFVRSGSTWTQQQKLTQNGSSDSFGSSVSISSDGNYAAIGALTADGSGRGAVYIYSRSGSTWTMQQKLTSSDRADFDYFGKAVSINSDGTYVIATAYGDADNGTSSGSAYIFTRSGSTWSQQAKIKPSDGHANAEFGGGQWNTPGVSASINSDATYVIVGSYYKGELDSESVGQQRTGAAYVFTRSGSTWTQQQKLSPSAIVAFTYFGNSVSINSDATYAIIGAHGDTSGAGAVSVFSRSGSTWTLERKITASDAQASDYFGLGVSLSSDAAYAIVGSIYEDGGSGDPIGNSGAAYIYEA